MTRAPSKPAALRRKLKEMIGEIHAANAHNPPDEIQKIVDDAVSEVRAERQRRKPRGSAPRKGCAELREQGRGRQQCCGKSEAAKRDHLVTSKVAGYHPAAE
jgi:hypothetical protein